MHIQKQSEQQKIKINQVICHQLHYPLNPDISIVNSIVYKISSRTNHLHIRLVAKLDYI